MGKGFLDKVQCPESGLQLLPKRQKKFESKSQNRTHVLNFAGRDSIPCLGMGHQGWCLDSCLSCDSWVGLQCEQVVVALLWTQSSPIVL